MPPTLSLNADFYATWCSACQKVYPVLCLIAEDKKLRKQFVFAKVGRPSLTLFMFWQAPCLCAPCLSQFLPCLQLQIDKFKGLVKSEGISVLPTVRCYGPKVRLF